MSSVVPTPTQSHTQTAPKTPNTLLRPVISQWGFLTQGHGGLEGSGLIDMVPCGYIRGHFYVLIVVMRRRKTRVVEDRALLGLV